MVELLMSHGQCIYYIFFTLIMVVGGSKSSQFVFKHSLICVPKMNGGLKGLELHEDE